MINPNLKARLRITPEEFAEGYCAVAGPIAMDTYLHLLDVPSASPRDIMIHLYDTSEAFKRSVDFAAKSIEIYNDT